MDIDMKEDIEHLFLEQLKKANIVLCDEHGIRYEIVDAKAEENTILIEIKEK